jgi:NhaP-type Na+/H+ or K+/H+ antiporter
MADFLLSSSSSMPDPHNCTCLLLDETHNDPQESHESHPHLAVLFPFVMLAVGAGADALTHRIAIPYTSLLLLIGSVVGYLMRDHWLGFLGDSAAGMADMDAHLLLFIFLPPLIFEAAYNIREEHFSRVAFAAITFAGPGLLISSGITSLFLRWFCYPDWNLYEAGLLGALLSATDPVAVVALLKEIGTGSLLDTLIEAESLLNDGTAMVVFTVLFEAVKNSNHLTLTPLEILVKFLIMAIGGPIFGSRMGYAMSKWIGSIFNHGDVEVTLTVCAAYLTFFIGEFYLGVSGVLAVVACGIYMGNRGDTLVSPEVEAFLHEFWELLGCIANTIIFFLTGVIIVYNRMWDSIHRCDFFNLLGVYVCIQHCCNGRPRCCFFNLNLNHQGRPSNSLRSNTPRNGNLLLGGSKRSRWSSPSSHSMGQQNIE